jgi:hypothetical protein
MMMMVGLLIISSFLRIKKVAGSNLSPETDCPVICYEFLLFLQANAGILPQGGHNTFIAHSSQLFCIWIYIIYAVDKGQDTQKYYSETNQGTVKFSEGQLKSWAYIVLIIMINGMVPRKLTDNPNLPEVADIEMYLLICTARIFQVFL